MKIRLEPQKTTIRLNKAEFEAFQTEKQLHNETIFPTLTKLDFFLKLKDCATIHYENDIMTISLPRNEIINHKPKKMGLEFPVIIDQNLQHLIIFEVDIKKPPLGSRR